VHPKSKMDPPLAPNHSTHLCVRFILEGGERKKEESKRDRERKGRSEKTAEEPRGKKSISGIAFFFIFARKTILDH
jgi:hypothetical protein